MSRETGPPSGEQGQALEHEIGSLLDGNPEGGDESIRVSPHESSQNGSAVFTSAITASQRHARRSSASVRAQPSRQTATAASASAADPSRPRISVAGASSRSAILMNMNDAPQIRASAASIAGLRRTILEVERTSGPLREASGAGGRESGPSRPVQRRH